MLKRQINIFNFIICFCLAKICFCQVIIIHIKSDTASYILDSTKMQYYFDYTMSNKINVEKLLKENYIDSFKTIEFSTEKKYKKEKGWLKLLLKNKTNYQVTKCLVLPDVELSVFVIDTTNKTDTIKAFDEYEKFIDNNRKKYLVYPITLDSLEKIMLFIEFDRIQDYFDENYFELLNTTTAFQLALLDKKFSIKKSRYYNLIYIGTFIWACFIIFIIFLIDKTKYHIYFFILILASTFVNLIDMYATNTIGNDISSKYFLWIIILLIIIYFSWFYLLRNMFETWRTMPKYDKFIKVFTLGFIPIGITLLLIIVLVLWGLSQLNVNIRDNFTVILKYGFISYVVLYCICLLNIPIRGYRLNNQKGIFFVSFLSPLFFYYFIIIPILLINFDNKNWLSNNEWFDHSLLLWAACGITLELFKNYNSKKQEVLDRTLENHVIQVQKEQQITELVRNQNEKLEELVNMRTTELTSSIKNLKDTQEKLHHSEKLASLGALTAGVAHEIQNPLNFINNFSEINKELIEEMDAEIKAGNVSRATVLCKDIAENDKKVLYHGKKAESIVKNMLLHSRTNTGIKELLDINVLIDEYWRLAYHGFRAKDKSFTINVNFDLDMTMERIYINEEDIGRVLLNLINNALYAVYTRQKVSTAEIYSPAIELITKSLGEVCIIKIKDNGIGIPEQIKAKIFQPFFTTKPPGQGAGLGLSLTYDIVTKGHNGKINVESKEGEGAIFTIELSNTKHA